MIHEAMFVLAVPNLQRSGAFYRDALGFEVHEMGDPGWRMFVRGSCKIMAGECPNAIPAKELGDHSYFAYLTSPCAFRPRMLRSKAVMNHRTQKL